MAGGTAQIHESALSQEDDTTAVREHIAVNLGLDVLALDVLAVGQTSQVNLIVEMSNVADNGVVLHLLHVLDQDDVSVASGSNPDVDLVDDAFLAHDLETFHAGLESTNGVDFSHIDNGSSTLQGLAAALANVTVAEHKALFTRDEHIDSPVKAIDEGMLAAVQVVELGLGDRVIDIDGREEQSALLVELVESVDSSGGLL